MAASYYRQLAYQYQAVDWALIALLLLIYLIMETAGTPHCRSFEWSDPSINYPMKSDTFPVYTLALMGLFVPLFYVVFSRFCVDPLRRVLGEPLSMFAAEQGGAPQVDGVRGEGASTCPPSTHLDSGSSWGGKAVSAEKIRNLKCGTGPVYPWVKAHFWVVVLELFLVDIMKLYAGRLRPDFLSRMADAGFTEETVGKHSPRTDPEYFCTLTRGHRAVREGRLSFPSGHSATSCAIFTVTTFYMLAHLRPFARQGSLTRLLISLSPMLLPVFCSVSRTRDNKHNFSDIVAGFFIGLVSALLVIATVFRQTGGPLSLYLARTDNDLEYVKQLLICSGNGGVSGEAAQRRPALGADYHTVSDVNKGSAAGTRASALSVMDDGMTIAVPVGYASQATSFANREAGSAGGEVARGVVLVETVCEREWNEDPAAVPWL